MNRVLTSEEVNIIQEIREINPRDEKDLDRLCVDFEELGDGLYRTGYKIVGTELVVKIPKRQDQFREQYARQHACQEIKVWKKLLRSPQARAVPPLRYSNSHGIIVTDVVLQQADTDKKTQSEIEEWKNNLKWPDGIGQCDMHHQNVGVYNRRFVVLDLGHFQL
jgi:hypothetical protein